MPAADDPGRDISFHDERATAHGEARRPPPPRRGRECAARGRRRPRRCQRALRRRCPWPPPAGGRRPDRVAVRHGIPHPAVDPPHPPGHGGGRPHRERRSVDHHARGDVDLPGRPRGDPDALRAGARAWDHLAWEVWHLSRSVERHLGALLRGWSGPAVEVYPARWDQVHSGLSELDHRTFSDRQAGDQRRQSPTAGLGHSPVGPPGVRDPSSQHVCLR
jgi:hypothetical protein